MGQDGFSRRKFLQSTVAASVAATVGMSTSQAEVKQPSTLPKMMSNKPNIIIITCDQLACDAISANGNKELKTNGIDRIFKNGTSFDKTYCQYPLCSPSRASFWTGQLPHQTKVMANESKMIHNRTTTIGSIFSEAGYETIHLGKTHDFGGLRGFDTARDNMEVEVETSPAYPESYQSRRDRVTVQLAKDYLAEQHDTPFVLAVEFYNPHNINNWIGEFAGPHGDIEGMGPLPPLRPNYENKDVSNRPQAIQYACCLQKRQEQTAQWTDKNFQQYLSAYYHFTQMADDMVGQVLDALEASDASENTLIVFMSDHGDGMGSHKLVAKSSYFYDEAARVPFVLMGKGIDKGRRINRVTGLYDLLPTLCDYAGITVPKPNKKRAHQIIHGRSLLPLIADENSKKWREYVVSQWHTQYEKNIVPARMLRTENYKYTHYLNDLGEELYDMVNDPLEQTNLIKDSAYTNVLNEMRTLFQEYLVETQDPYFDLEPKLRLEFGKHPEGYINHV